MSSEPNIMWHTTISALLDKAAADYPDRLAVKYTDRDYHRTWSQFSHEVDRAARGFIACGIGKGDHIAIWATNIPEWIITMFAAARIGAVLVTVNTNYKLFEEEYLLRQSDTKVLVLSDGFKDSNYKRIMHELVPELRDSVPGQLESRALPVLKLVLHAGSDNADTQGMLPFSDLYKLADNVPHDTMRALADTITPEDIASILYTSGTTGYPKGVMLTHFNLVNNGRDIGRCMKFTPEDKLCIPVPFFHCFGLTLSILACLTHASGMVPIEHFRPLEVLKALDSEQCTAVHGVPTMFIAQLEHPDFKKFKLNLRTGIMAGSPCPVKVMQQVVDEMHMSEIVITYGQTEASPGCTMTNTTDSLEKRVSTVGRAMPGVEMKVVDTETGETLTAGKKGELCARGYNLMKGYYKMPEATAQAIDREGWLHTGDIGTVDEEGYYKITGRLKDMIIRGGENVYPKEIEEFIYTVPGVSDVQVIGVPDKQYGEEIMAVVILKEGVSMTEEELKDKVRASMSRHKVPKYVKFTDSFPMTASGKIQKYKMREQAVEELGLSDAAAIVTA
ncbi:MAG: AMP-binding protein [Eubacteriales bacterium]